MACWRHTQHQIWFMHFFFSFVRFPPLYYFPVASTPHSLAPIDKYWRNWGSYSSRQIHQTSRHIYNCSPLSGFTFSVSHAFRNRAKKYTVPLCTSIVHAGLQREIERENLNGNIDFCGRFLWKNKKNMKWKYIAPPINRNPRMVCVPYCKLFCSNFAFFLFYRMSTESCQRSGMKHTTRFCCFLVWQRIHNTHTHTIAIHSLIWLKSRIKLIWFVILWDSQWYHLPSHLLFWHIRMFMWLWLAKI